MASTDPRHAYVRFYLTVLEQLDQVRGVLEATAVETRTAVAPFADVLAVGDDPDLERVLDPPLGALATSTLWRPEDPALLTGIVDVYDVIGRFTFQGEDDSNLARVTALVRAAVDEIERQRRTLGSLARMPSTATHAAEGLSQQELAAAEAARAERLKPFEPVAEQLRLQCVKVLDAVHAIPRPDLVKLDSADALYKEYVRRAQTLYTAALPYLRRALQELCTVAAVEVPPGWPDTLPFLPSLPPDLITAPPLESTAMSNLHAQITQADEEEVRISRRLDELALAQRRIEAEKLALLQKETETMAEVHIAKHIVRWATKYDELDSTHQAIDAQNQQKRARQALMGQLQVQHQQLEVTQANLQAEVRQRELEFAATSEALAKERGNAPAIFGKDEWRQRVADLDEDVSERKVTLTQRMAVLAQCSADINAVQSRAESEKTQIALIDRSSVELREREENFRKELSDIETQLGANKPAHRLTLPQADEYLTRVWAARNEVRAAIDRLTAQLRQAAEETDRLGTQARQLLVDRQRAREALERATEEAGGAYEEALAALAERRKSGFVQHVTQVLAPLEESLTQVDRIFIDPARQVLLQRSVGEAPKAGSLRAQAGGLAEALAQLAPRVEPVLATQTEVLRRVQGEFCEKVQDAVRAAWAA